MRRTVHDAAAQFRVNAELLTKAEANARCRGMSMSEFMRHAIRKELDAA